MQIPKLTKVHLAHHGFSTIEILIAFSVGIIFLSAAMMVAFSDPTLSKQISLENGQAAALDATLDNTALATSTNRLGKILETISKNWTTTVTNSNDDIYTNTANVVDISPCMKEITSTTTWGTLNSRDRHMTFGTAISNIDIAKALGRGGCDPISPGDWDSPKKYPNGITISAVNANDISVTSNVGKTIVVLGTTASSPAKEDLYLYDLSDPQNPSTVLGMINTGKESMLSRYMIIMCMRFKMTVLTNSKLYAYSTQQNQLLILHITHRQSLHNSHSKELEEAIQKDDRLRTMITKSI